MGKHYEVYSHENFSIIEILDEQFDFFNIPDLSKEFNNFLEKANNPNLIFNLNKIMHIDSSGFGFLVNIRNRLSKKNKEIIIVVNNEEILDIIEMLKMPQFFKIFKSMNGAVEYMMDK